MLHYEHLCGFIFRDFHPAYNPPNRKRLINEISGSNNSISLWKQETRFIYKLAGRIFTALYRIDDSMHEECMRVPEKGKK